MLAWHGEHVWAKIMLAAPAQDARHLIFVIPTDGKDQDHLAEKIFCQTLTVGQYPSMIALFTQKFIMFFWIQREKAQAHLMDLI